MNVIEAQLKALEEAAGSWTAEKHLELLTEEDIDNWLRELRASWGPFGSRLARLAGSTRSPKRNQAGADEPPAVV